jgi:hypothetical protein
MLITSQGNALKNVLELKNFLQILQQELVLFNVQLDLMEMIRTGHVYKTVLHKCLDTSLTLLIYVLRNVLRLILHLHP